MNFTFCKNRCNYTKRNKQSRNPPLSVQSFQIRTIPRKSPTPLPPLSKVRCCRPKKFGRLPEGLPHHSSQNRTIPPAFCRASVCVCLYGFASALSLEKHYILASLVKGEVLSPERIRATTGGIAFLPHPFRFSDTSVNNPSVTVTENTILCQRIFNFYKKQY